MASRSLHQLLIGRVQVQAQARVAVTPMAPSLGPFVLDLTTIALNTPNLPCKPLLVRPLQHNKMTGLTMSPELTYMTKALQ